MPLIHRQKKEKPRWVLKDQADREVQIATTYHQRGALVMAQGLLPFHYVSESSLPGLTALASLPLYLDLAHIEPRSAHPGAPIPKRLSPRPSA